MIPLNRRNTGRGRPKTPYRRAMRHGFSKPFYNQRWHVEGSLSQHKRRLGSALIACNSAAQMRELILRVLTHNLMLLADIT